MNLLIDLRSPINTFDIVLGVEQPVRYIDSIYWSSKQRKSSSTYVADTNVPTLVKMSEQEVEHCFRGDGLDFIITDAYGNLIPREIVGFSKTEKKGHYWYKDPDIDTTKGGSVVYAQYGGASVFVPNSQSVWQDCHGGTMNYLLTCHMENSAENSASNNYQPASESFSYATGEVGNHAVISASTNDSNHGNIAEIQNASALTVFGWWKTTDFSNTRYISNQYSSSTVKHQIITYAGNFYTYIGGGGVDTNGYFAESGVITSDVSFHFASVFNGLGSGNTGRLQMYIDGAQQTLTYSGTIPSSIGAAAGNFTIGQSPWTLTGSVDEFRVLLGALSINQIKNSYYNEYGFSTNASITEGAERMFDSRDMWVMWINEDC